MPHIVYLESVTGYSDAENGRRLDLLRSHLRPGFTIELLKAPGGPAILERPRDFEQAGRAALAAVSELRPARCRAVISAGAVDPGLEELRAASAVPVIGPGEASMFLARLVAKRLVILTVEPAVPAAFEMIARVPARPETVIVHRLATTVRKILADLDAGRRFMRDEAAAAVREHRADALYLGSMTQGSLGVTGDLRAEFGIPVLDPMPISLYAAQEAAAALGP
ncbi:MAG TPA: aspartate/glutamate racemase family protein [bacterium]|nr:aspartate/glutamate racemase family protein [bacterium]